MTNAKRYAVLLENGAIIGEALTAATNGSVVSYGKALPGGGLHEVGRAKISRNARKLWLSDLFGMPLYDVNDGGGAAY